MPNLPSPFEIRVPEQKLDLLRQKLALADFPDELTDAEPWTQGVPLFELKRLVNIWKDVFDWRHFEAETNKIPQFTCRIDVNDFGSYKMHFIHQRSCIHNAIPLLFLHGWPGSFLEVTRLLPGLVNGTREFPAFDVVAPSLIDFGFSDASKRVSSLQIHLLVSTIDVREERVQHRPTCRGRSRADAYSWLQRIRYSPDDVRCLTRFLISRSSRARRRCWIPSGSLSGLQVPITRQSTSC